MKLKVLVRVRPMSQREKQSNAQHVVQIESGTNLAVTNIKVSQRNAGDSRERIRRFAFDYCFDKNVTQDEIFKTVESIVEESLKRRCHSCVLAYGQTSSGKTHTMMGVPQDLGLTPRLCRKIFKYFEKGAVGEEASQLRLTVSYLEIYNEKVADLLEDDDILKNRPKKHLKVREHPKKGPHVEGLSEHIVTNDKELLERLEQGTAKRRIGSTSTNPRSSRSHSVFSMTCDGVKLHLVDLAGNERASARSYGSSRFREGANINKSLVALGNVISVLAEQSRLSLRNRFVPYRDSVLTWLLKDTLQGSSNTVMIATISPSSSCYSETVNTLRFGQRAKLIVYKPIIYEDPKERTIRKLRAEIVKLRELLNLSNEIPTQNQDCQSKTMQNNQIHSVNNSINGDEIIRQIDASYKNNITSKMPNQTEEYLPENITVKSEDESNRIKSNIGQTEMFLSEILPELAKTKQNLLKDQSKTTLAVSTAENYATSTSETSEKLLPVMNVTSLVSPISNKKQRTFSIDRAHSVESENSRTPSENSKTFSSQESLQSPKHKSVRRASKNSSISSSRESLSSNARRLSNGSTSSIPPKQTSTSLRRQSLTKTSPLLKTITQKKLLGSLPKNPEKSINTELASLKNIEPKVDTNRKQISRAKTQLVASVTQRLYAKANKKDLGIGTDNCSNSARPELPKELAICNNARLRLKELTQKALKSQKSKSVETQTDLYPVLRVKEISTDCNGLKKDLAEVKDVSTSNVQETIDAQVECTLLNNFIENDLRNVLIVTRSCGSQTTDDKNPISFKRYLTETSHGNPIITESLNINISHNYINERRKDSLSDDSLDTGPHNVGFPTPDLISNHNSLEQHGQLLESERINSNRIKFATSKVIQNNFEETILRLQPEETFKANKVNIEIQTEKIKNVQWVSYHASQIVMPDIFKEKTKPLPKFDIPKLVSPRLVEYRELIHYEPLVIKQPVMERTIFRTNSKDCYAVNQEHILDEDPFSDIADSIEFHTSNRKKVQFYEKPHGDTHHKNEKLFQAMTDFVEEATTLMKNLSKTATKIDLSLHKNCLEDCELQVTVDNVTGLDSLRRERIRRKSFNNGTQTDELKQESCCSQTTEEILDFMLPINKYEVLLEDSCKRLEQKINKKYPRTRHTSDVTQDSDDEFVCNAFSQGNNFFLRPKYNPWDLSNLEVEDSSLESNPVAFSDYGSLPRKTHKRQRTPTCSPSAFLKQLTNMRKQVIETSKDNLYKNSA